MYCTNDEYGTDGSCGDYGDFDDYEDDEEVDITDSGYVIQYLCDFACMGLRFSLFDESTAKSHDDLPSCSLQ
jgi:hypothetical protein